VKIETALLAIGAVATVSTVILALRTFRTNLKVKRAEWLMKLYDKFYEDEERTRIRRLLDPSEKREQLLDSLGSKRNNKDIEKDVESFSDYLNFFEFVGILMKLKQVEEDEVEMMFDYYVRQLQDDRIKKFCEKYSYERTLELLKVFPKRPSKDA
jgi:hypothetical protein